jgi:type I restriction enzyme S subunit
VSAWPVARLGDIAQFQNGRAFKPSEWSAVGLPIIRIENLTDPSAQFNRFEGLVDERHLVRDGDLLVSWSASLDAFIWNRGVGVLNQHIFKVAEDANLLDRSFFFHALRYSMTAIRAQVHGATMQHITKPAFKAVTIPLPPLDEQRRIAGRLREQLVLRDPLAGRLSANQSVLDQLQRRLVEQAATIALTAPTDSIGRLADSPPSPSVKSDGVASVIAVTSGCLTSAGWSEAGLKAARMNPADVGRGTLGPGEVLVSRSNTGELVGRSAVFPGSARPIVATDLIFRLRADRTRLLPEYLAIQLQAMQLKGYWRDRSSGASSTMKKITRTQMNAVVLPLPPVDEQRQIAARLHGQLAEIDRAKDALAAQRKAIDALPAALLREVFGELIAA